MTLHLSGALASGNVVTAVQTIAGPLPASETDFDYKLSHTCIDVSPSGEYILVTDNYGSSSASPFSKYNIRPSLVVYQSSSLSGYTPVTEVALAALDPGTSIDGTNYANAVNLLHDWYFIDNETIVGATKSSVPSLGISASRGNLIFITGSDASWGISHYITSSEGFGYTGDAHSSQRGTTNADDLPLSGDNFNVGTGSATSAAIGNWGNTSVDHWKVTPNNTHTDTPATRIAVHATKEVNENGYGSDLITVFKKLEGQTEFSFHSQFSPEDMNVPLDTDNQFWSAELGGSNRERCVQDVVFIEEDVIVVAYISSDSNATDLAPFKYDNSDNKWKPFGYTGTRLTGLDGLASRAITNINSHGYRWLEYDPHSKRLFVGADSSTINIFNSSSNWLTSLYDGSSGNLGTPSEIETYSALSIGGGERNLWSMPRNTKWRFTPGHALGISIPVFKSSGGTSGALKPFSRIFWHESSSAEGWSTYSTSDNYFKVADINENGNSLTGKSDGIATMTTSGRNSTSTRFGNMYGWNSQGGGTGDIIVYREANDSSGNSSNFSTSRLIVLDLNSQPALPVPPALTLTPTSITVSETGTTATVTVTLNQDPGFNMVDVSVYITDSTEVSVDQTIKMLTTSNWDTGVEFTFTGQDDSDEDGNQTFNVVFTTTASGDASFDSLEATLSVTVEDNDTAGSTETEDPATSTETEDSTISTETTIKQGVSEVARSLADYLPRKMHFDPSTIENIDRSVLNYLTRLNLFSDTNEGWRKVPIIWGTAERAYQVKHNKDVRDQQGMLKLPLISIRRVSLTKDMPSKGVFQGTAPAHDDEQGGSLTVGRMIYQDKTTKFANADAARLHNQKNYPSFNNKIVYRTVSAPMPVNVSVMYEITLRTEYQQQMNHLMLPFITTPGTINYVRLFDGEHRYEAFIQGDMQYNDNLADFSSDERKFETKIQLKVVGYLIGEENNREKPHYAIRENAVEIKIPRERISLAEIPEMEYGRYYGLEGVPQEDLKDPSPFFTRTKKDPRTPFFFSNVPAIGAGLAADVVAGASSSSTTDVSTSLITRGNFSETLADNMVVRELLKSDSSAPPSPANQLVATIATIRPNTESVFVNGMIQALGSSNDYTISGNTITFTFDLTAEDSVYVTYIKG